MNRNSATTRFVLAGILAFGVSAGVLAQSTPQSTTAVRPVQEEEEKVVLEKYVVTGALAGQARAVEMQREADNLVNVVSADKIGTFPDLNAAEALRRLPAVSLYFNSSGEGRFISIRGARPNYNGTLLNGFTVPSGDRSERTVDLQTLSNALIERIEITKAATADMPAEGIGGVTNIVLNNPLTQDGRTMRGSVYYGHNEYDGFEFRGDASYGDFIGAEKKYAFQVAANFRSAERDLYESTIRDFAMRPGSGGAQVFLPGRAEFKMLKEEHYNAGTDLSFGAKLSDRSTLLIRGFYSRYWRPSTRTSIEIGSITPFTVGGSAVDLTAGGGLVNTVAEREWRTSDWNLYLYGTQITLESKLTDTLTAEAGFGYHYALEKYTKDTTVTTDSRTATGPLRIEMTPHMVYFHPNWSAPGAMYDHTTMRIRRWTHIPFREDEETEIVPRFDLTKRIDEFGGGGSLEIKGGFYGRLREKQAEIEQIRRNQVAGSNLTFAALGTEFMVTDFDKKGFLQGPWPNYDTAMNIAAANPTAFPVLQLLNPRGYENDASDFLANEDIYAGYAMGTYKTDRMTVIAGARYEQTKEEFKRFSTSTGVGLVTTSDSYEHILPSVHVKYELRDNLFLRASWGQTVARPNPETIYGNLIIDRTARTINEPSPGLESLESRNIDLSVDWYFGPLGQFMVGYFSKDIDNFPFTQQDTVTFEGQSFVRTRTSARASGNIDGFEATYRRTLDFLPEPFSGLGFDINYAKLDSEILSPLRPDRPRLEMQPEHILNGSLYYAHNRFYVRLAVAHQGKMIDRAGTGASALFDRYEKERTQYDLSASFDLRDNIQLFGEWRNVTNAELEYYYPSTGNLGVRRTFGTQIGAGVRVHF